MKTHSRRRKNIAYTPKQDMAAMIDIVFLLLVFFVFTVKPEDVLAKLSADRPQGEDHVESDIPMINIVISKDGYSINQQKINLESMERKLGKIAGLNPDNYIIVSCTADSSHSGLIKVLNICSKLNIKKIALMSL